MRFGVFGIHRQGRDTDVRARSFASTASFGGAYVEDLVDGRQEGGVFVELTPETSQTLRRYFADAGQVAVI